MGRMPLESSQAEVRWASSSRDEDEPLQPNITIPAHRAIQVVGDDSEHKSKSKQLKKEQEQQENTDDEKVVPIAPDGGYGWIIVMASFFCNFIVDGVAYSFAVYFIEWMAYFPKDSKAMIALIGALLNGVYLCMGPISSALTNAFGFRKVIFSGAVISAFAFICSMFAPSIPWLVVTFGIIGGTGFGLIYSPAILCVCYYFDKKRAMAVGVSVCGSGVGALVVPPLVEMIVEAYGWHGSMLLLAGFVLQVCVAGALMRTLEVEVTDEMECRPSTEEVVPFITKTEIDTFVREGPELDRTLSLTSAVPIQSSLRDGHAGHKCNPSTSESGPVQIVTSRKYSSQHGIDVMTVEKETVQHLYKHGPHHRYFSTPDIPQDVSHPKTARKSIEVFPPLDRKDIFHQGSLKHIDKKTIRKVEMDAFRSSQGSLHIHRHVTLVTVGDKNMPKKSCLPPPLRQAFVEMTDLRIYRNLVFMIFSVASFLGMIAFYIPFGFISKFSQQEFEVPLATAIYLISAIGGANVFGRIFWGWLADRPRMDPLVIHNVCVCIVGVVMFCIPLCQGHYGLMAVCVVFGFFVSPFISLLSIILTSRIGLELLPSAFGQSQFVRGIASMVGTPIAGGLLDVTGNNYTPVFYAAGGALLAASLIASLIFFLPLCSRKHKNGQRYDNRS